MNNLKTAVLVVVLLGALYGAYQYLNGRDVKPLPEVLALQQQDLAPPDIDFGGPTNGDANSSPIVSSGGPPTGFSPAEVSAPKFESPGLNAPAFPQVNAAGNAASPPAAAATAQPSGNDPWAAKDPPVPADDSFDPGAARRSTYASQTQPPAEKPAAKSDDGFVGIQANPFYDDGGKPGAQRPLATDVGARPRGTHDDFLRDWNSARQQVEAGKFSGALAGLSPYYDNPELSSAERNQLLRTLDMLAGRVIYSTDHYLEQPYTVRPSETLMDVAAQYKVPYQLLQNINGIKDPQALVPQTKLKVVRGPFHADLNLTTGELTLLVDKYYAGRFNVSVGQDPVPMAGEYTVQAKKDGKEYRLSNGKVIPPRHPDNPYGQYWLDLGKETSLHGSAENPVAPELGCISLSPVDAADAFGILSEGSVVKIRR